MDGPPQYTMELTTSFLEDKAAKKCVTLMREKQFLKDIEMTTHKLLE